MELTNTYFDFDPRLFAPEEGLREAVRDESIITASGPYKELLTRYRDQVEQVMTDGFTPANLGNEFYIALVQSVQAENLPLSKIPFKYKAERTGDYSPETQKLGNNRIGVHLLRLLNPSEFYHIDPSYEIQNPIQKRFAQDYMTAYKHLSSADKFFVSRLVGGEGDGARFFWTLAPYVYHFLLTELGEKKSMKTLLNWVAKGSEKMEHNIPLDSLAYVPEAIWQTNMPYALVDKFVLGIDERMSSHILARIMGKYVADKLLTHS